MKHSAVICGDEGTEQFEQGSGSSFSFKITLPSDHRSCYKQYFNLPNNKIQDNSKRTLTDRAVPGYAKKLPVPAANLWADERGVYFSKYGHRVTRNRMTHPRDQMSLKPSRNTTVMCTSSSLLRPDS